MTKNVNDSQPPPRQPRAIINDDANMLAEAKKYAALGWPILPVHVPIHNAAGKVTGCTCEHYKRSEANHQRLIAKGKGQEYDPNYKCPKPGKCPAVHWSSEATTDPKKIAKWWGRPWHSVDVETGEPVLFYPNIAEDCGKSDHLVQDADSYKEDYGGADYLSHEDRQTVTAITAQGGEHLFFAREGLPYSNANGSLPYGNDIRGVGGYIVLAPSLHANGRRHQWEEGYAPGEIPLKPIREAKGLYALLETTHQQKHTADAITVTFGPVSAEAPDLEQWDLSETVTGMIHNPAGRGHRSEQDAYVVTALCANGAGDDDILAVFSHYPIGTAGKYAERGPDYLKRTIQSCRRYLDEQAAEHQRNLDTIEALRYWVRSHSFAELIPTDKRASTGYRTDAQDTKTADAILAEMHRLGMQQYTIGEKRLAKLAGLGSKNTAKAAAERLSPWLFTLQRTPEGMTFTLNAEFRFAEFDPYLSLRECEIGVKFSKTNQEYTQLKVTDAYLAGTSRHVKNLADEAVQVTGGTRKDWLATIPRGLGETALRIRDALTRCGDMTIKELAEETGKKSGSLGRACHMLETHGLLESEREHSCAPKVYSLAPDFDERVDELAPTLRTYKLSAEREAKRLKEVQQWELRQQLKTIEAGDEEAYNHHEHKLKKLGNQRLWVLGHLYPNLDEPALAKLAFDVQLSTDPHPAVLAKLERMHAQARMDNAETLRKASWDLNSEIWRWRKDGLSKADIVRRLEQAKYTRQEAWGAVNQAWPSQQQPATVEALA